MACSDSVSAGLSSPRRVNNKRVLIRALVVCISRTSNISKQLGKHGVDKFFILPNKD